MGAHHTGGPPATAATTGAAPPWNQDAQDAAAALLRALDPHTAALRQGRARELFLRPEPTASGTWVVTLGRWDALACLEWTQALGLPSPPAGPSATIREIANTAADSVRALLRRAGAQHLFGDHYPRGDWETSGRPVVSMGRLPLPAALELAQLLDSRART